MRLNRYLALGGVCARREADKLIESGVVAVNGQVVTTLGTKVTIPQDEVTVKGKPVVPEPMVYLLMNKPKNTLSTAKDPEGRPTVLSLVRGKVRERVFPVGRLDRNTTGLLLLTNDGELATKLSHPRYGVRKRYKVRLDRPLEQEHLDQLIGGLTLDDGPIRPDMVQPDPDGDPSVWFVELHSGRNRIVRRMFEHLGYDLQALDRVAYAFLTKKNLSRGRFRPLTDQEVGWLKMTRPQG